MTTTTKTLLHAIWTGEVAPVPSHQKHALFDLLEVLFKARMVLIEVPEGPLCGKVLQETAELMPDLPLGDILEEELDLSVPVGAIVVCLSARALGAAAELPALSKALGTISAQVIVDAVHLADAPVADERKEMQRLADMLMSVVRSLAEAHVAVETTPFKAALARGFAATLEGRAARNLADATLAARFVPEAEAPGPAAHLLDTLMTVGVPGTPRTPITQPVGRKV